ncbi:hypothetical protein HY546_03695 [archaeon]|nr:hypothetical protein [archaeon]
MKVTFEKISKIRGVPQVKPFVEISNGTCPVQGCLEKGYWIRLSDGKHMVEATFTKQEFARLEKNRIIENRKR